MQITILTIGARGDVQPYVALGMGLQSAGHAVCVATETNYQHFVTQCGLDFAPLPGDTKAFMATEAGYRWQQSGRSLNQMRQDSLVAYLKPILQDQLTATWQACQGAEAILAMPFVVGAYSVAEKLNLPFYGVWTTASTPTTAFPHPLLGIPNLGGALNWWSHVLMAQLFWQSLRPEINRWRREFLQLPAIHPLDVTLLHRRKIPSLYAYSPSFCPKPPDWPDWVNPTGYWFLNLPSNWAPSPDLLEFLQAGPAPIYVGFGSLTDRQSGATTQLVLDAIARTGHRAMLEPGWAELGKLELPPHIFKLSAEVPHRWLFPQMAALVHHGGSGTTGTGLAAGVPQVAVYRPFGANGFSARQLAKVGVAPAPIPREKLTVDRLTAAIQTATTDGAIRRRAAELGQKIRAEDGVGRAVQLFHEYLPRPG
jgi:sterol 3beta-glucosyltransferase